MDLQINIPLFRTTMVGHHGSDVNFVDPWHPLDPLCQGRKGWEIPLMTNKSSLFYMWDPCEIQLTNSLLSPESCCGKWHKTSWPRRCFVPRRREKKTPKNWKKITASMRLGVMAAQFAAEFCGSRGATQFLSIKGSLYLHFSVDLTRSKDQFFIEAGEKFLQKTCDFVSSPCARRRLGENLAS